VLARTEANTPGHVAVLKRTLQNRHSCIEGNVRFAGSGNPHSQGRPSKGSLQKRDIDGHGQAGQAECRFDGNRPREKGGALFLVMFQALYSC
jgi:hypothetical protein